MIKKDNTNLYKKLDELEDIIRENTILIKKNKGILHGFKTLAELLNQNNEKTIL